MLASTPLIKNLDNPEYLEIILDGKQNLEERFAQIDDKQVREQLKEQQDAERKYAKGMVKIFKLCKLPKLVTIEIDKAAA